MHQVRLAGDLLVILVERDDLLRDAIHDLLFEVCVYVLWEAIEKVSDEFVISLIRLQLVLNASDHSGQLAFRG